MFLGIMAGLTTGALWGLTFVAPRAVSPFTEVDLAIVRYGVFCIVSILSMRLARSKQNFVSRRQMIIALLLGSVGYIGNFLMTAFAVRLAGATIPPIIIGVMPVALAVVGNLNKRAIPWRSLAFPLVLISVGVMTANVWGLATADHGRSQMNVLLGIACSIGALLIWIVYGILNASVMRTC